MCKNGKLHIVSHAEKKIYYKKEKQNFQSRHHDMSDKNTGKEQDIPGGFSVQTKPGSLSSNKKRERQLEAPEAMPASHWLPYAGSPT